MDVVIVRPGDPIPVMPSMMVYPTTSKGEIAFCDRCFESRRFGALSPDDVEVITWFFGAAYAEEQPARAVTLLEPMLAKWRAPDLLSPLGRAYVRVGRIDEGKALLKEALSLNPEHAYSIGDRKLLEDEGA
jgi:hypothetical protein